MTDVRYDQIDAFEKWLVEEQGMTGPGGGPPVDVRLDAGNDDVSKKLIQSVSGVAGDLIDMRGGDRVRYLQDTGALMDVTEAAKSMGFDPSATYPTITEEFVIDGKQYGFPCNVYTQLYWVNVEAFERLGMEVPPRRWTIGEFERIGKEFVERANAGEESRRHFFANGVDTLQILRAMTVRPTAARCSTCTCTTPTSSSTASACPRPSSPPGTARSRASPTTW